MRASATSLARALLFLVMTGLVVAFFATGLQGVVSLEALRSQERDLLALQDSHPVLLAGGYVLLYVVLAALSLPVSAIITVAGGAIFGVFEGTLLASFGSSLGAMLAFLASRFLFREFVRRRFQSHLDQVNRGLERNGWVYLLSLRLVPAIPFFIVNLIFGITSVPLAQFYIASQIGMLPAALVYVYAGTQIAHLNSLSGILSPGLIGSLLLLAALPLAAKAITRRLVRRQ